jgi:hypothetical protein
VTELLYADLALAHNDVTNAVGVFTDVLNRPILVATPIYYRAVATLADALISSREYARASAIITKALSMRESETLQYNSAPFWMPLQTRLADLDRRAGRLGEAQRLEAELSDLLSLADPDFPLVRRLRRAALAAEK